MNNGVSLTRVEGVLLDLRLVEPADAAFIHDLRTDSRYNRHLSPVQGGVADQRAWIEAYKAREAERRELYYVIVRKDGAPCGLVRLYGIGAEDFTWGSWILADNKPPKAALESAMLSFGVGFDHLDCGTALVDVRVRNVHAYAFYRRLGMTELRRTEQDIYFAYPRSRYARDRAGFLDVIQEAAAARTM